MPPGCHVVPLPYADDVRALKMEPQARCLADGPEEHAAVTAARSIVRRVNLGEFTCSLFENPALRKHFAAVEALALDEASLEWSAESDTLQVGARSTSLSRSPCALLFCSDLVTYCATCG